MYTILTGLVTAEEFSKLKDMFGDKYRVVSDHEEDDEFVHMEIILPGISLLELAKNINFGVITRHDNLLEDENED